jgi:hypothetical protein
MTNLKIKFGIILALPFYFGISLVVIILASIIWILAKILKIVGFLDGMNYLLVKTKQKINHIKWMNSLHPHDRETLKKSKK